jgi:hypothetical protein
MVILLFKLAMSWEIAEITYHNYWCIGEVQSLHENGEKDKSSLKKSKVDSSRLKRELSVSSKQGIKPISGWQTNGFQTRTK